MLCNTENTEFQFANAVKYVCKMDEKKKKTVGEIVTTFRAFEQKKGGRQMVTCTCVFCTVQNFLEITQTNKQFEQ